MSTILAHEAGIVDMDITLIKNALDKYLDDNPHIVDAIRTSALVEHYMFSPAPQNNSTTIQEISAQEVTDKFNS